MPHGESRNTGLDSMEELLVSVPPIAGMTERLPSRSPIRTSTSVSRVAPVSRSVIAAAHRREEGRLRCGLTHSQQ
jgi:hypothetical protein